MTNCKSTVQILKMYEATLTWAAQLHVVQKVTRTRILLTEREKLSKLSSVIQPVWRSRALRTSTKIRMLHTTGKSTLLYGSETWRETATSNSKIQTFINRCLRNILGIWWPEKISNTISGIGPINNLQKFKSDQGSRNRQGKL